MNQTFRYDEKDIKIVEKVCKVLDKNPSIDGHMWVVRDDKIFDPHFIEYDILKKYHKGKKFIYYPADKTTQNVMIAIITKIILTEYPTVNEFLVDYKIFTENRKLHGYCMFNALMEIETNGGQLIFGSWGFLRADGTKFYEYGGEDYHGVNAFLKK